MATLRHIEANRRNSQKSGHPLGRPRTPEAKSVSRFNALKSGIDAHAQVIPGESAAELEAVTDDYRRQFSPATPLENFLVDALVYADWQLRRLRKIESKLWDKLANSDDDESALNRLTRLQRRIDAAERSYYRALRELRRLQPEKDPACAEEDASPARAPELASFHLPPQPMPPHVALSSEPPPLALPIE